MESLGSLAGSGFGALGSRASGLGILGRWLTDSLRVHGPVRPASSQVSGRLRVFRVLGLGLGFIGV